MKNLRQQLMHYTDGTPSREIEDWGENESDEMNRIYEECKSKINRGSTLLKTRDRLINVIDVIIVCREALDSSALLDIKTLIRSVLHFQVIEQLQSIDEELSQLWKQLK